MLLLLLTTSAVLVGCERRGRSRWINSHSQGRGRVAEPPKGSLSEDLGHERRPTPAGCWTGWASRAGAPERRYVEDYGAPGRSAHRLV